MSAPGPPSLPRLRRRRRPLSLARLAGLVSTGVANINATLEPFAQYWDDHNLRMLKSDGPLWVALGDSVTQGIGASHPEKSYVPLVMERLQERSSEPWRVINLSMSGGRFEDVIRHQLPAIRAAGLEPAVVSAVIGSNDVIWRRDTDGIIADARGLIDALPPQTLLSRLSEAREDARRLGVNSVFDLAAADGGVHLFEAWDWPAGEQMWAEDRFHPSDNAYVHLADNVWNAIVRHTLPGRHD